MLVFVLYYVQYFVLITNRELLARIKQDERKAALRAPLLAQLRKDLRSSAP